MIEHDVIQGSVEWLTLRLGIPTASEFKRIVTDGGKLSKQSRDYAIYLVTEKILNRSLDSLDNLEWVERGKQLEPDAVRMYEFSERRKTRAVGFVTSDDGRLGASPDRLLVGCNAGVEIKCPAPHTHVANLIDGFGNDYRAQVQGQMLVCGFDFVDRYSFHPEMPPFLQRTVRDEPYLKLLADALDQFCDMKDAMLERARRAGWFFEAARPQTPVEAAYGGIAPLNARELDLGDMLL